MYVALVTFDVAVYVTVAETAAQWWLSHSSNDGSLSVWTVALLCFIAGFAVTRTGYSLYAYIDKESCTSNIFRNVVDQA